MIQFIKLTLLNTDTTVYINPEHIGHIYNNITSKYTSVGVTTHNNGGFKVKETPKEIIKQIGATK